MVELEEEIASYRDTTCRKAFQMFYLGRLLGCSIEGYSIGTYPI